ncbi:hypothetical protein ACUODJ_07090, partial [Escherichia sp. HC-CC]
MTDNTYQPAKVWTWDKSAGGAFANINQPGVVLCTSNAQRQQLL